MHSNTILYFVKYPAPGKVKTRLAKSIGDKAAVKMYRHLAENNFNVIKRLYERKVCDLVVVFEPREKMEDFRKWLAVPCEYWPQSAGGLSERLTSAFREAFSAKGGSLPDRQAGASGGQKGGNRVMALGSDTLGLTADVIQQGFEALRSSDVVVGPAEDGGYYLVGSASFQPKLFEGISWSTSEVLAQTYKAISDLRLSCQTLPQLEDLDEIKIGEKHERIFT